MEIVGLTMAKGSSSRLPRKNLLPFAGKPLVEWTLIAMESARYLTDLWMVTESEEIADIAYEHRFRVLFQSRESAATAGHYGAPVCEKLFFDEAGYQYDESDVLVTGLPTSPCRKPGDIDEVVSEYLRRVSAYPERSVGVGTMVRRKDIQLMEETGNGLKPVLFDNLGKYLATNGSVGARSIWYAREQAKELPKIMEAFKSGTHYAGFAKDPEFVAFVENEVWQQWDIDSRADFEMCEQLFLANGLGEEEYKRYRGRC